MGCKTAKLVVFYKTRGEMVEWFKAAVLKTAEGQLSEGSNPSFSAIFFCLFSSGGQKITAKIIILKVASKLALEFFHFCMIAFCMMQKA